MTHWIAVADSQVCRLYSADEDLERWTPVRVLENPRLHPDPGDLGGRGRTQAMPGGPRSAMDRHTDPVDTERQRFAREVAEVLDEAFVHGQWDRLIVAAPPKFLGLLRAELPERAARGLVATIDHDFVKTPERDLPDAVRKHLPALAGLE